MDIDPDHDSIINHKHDHVKILRETVIFATTFGILRKLKKKTGEYRFFGQAEYSVKDKKDFKLNKKAARGDSRARP
jgi:hypothetical protein